MATNARPAPAIRYTNAQLLELLGNASTRQAEMQVRATEQSNEIRDTRARLIECEKARDRNREAINDLKERLERAEARCRWLDGYVARVHGDDVVREELVPTGEPGGVTTLVPKRKPEQPPGMEPERSRGSTLEHYSAMTGGEPRPQLPRKWVLY